MRLERLHRTAICRRKAGPAAIPASVLQSHRQDFIPPNLSPATPAPALSTSPPATAWKTISLGSQNGLPIYSPVDDDGKFAHTSELPVEQQMPSEMVGKSILEKHGKSDANEAVLHELRVRHALLHQENYHHSYPHCWRSKTPIIFRAMDQWFIKIDHVVGDDVPRRPKLLRSKDGDAVEASLPSVPPPSLRLTASNGCRNGVSTASKARCKPVPTGASRASARGACRFRRFTTPKANRCSTPKSSATPPT